jgi:hypothetical protein
MTEPEIRVLRHSFYAVSGRGHLRWTEACPALAHRHHAECGCTVDAEARPQGTPAEVQQEVTVAWPDCLVILDEAYSAPWVKFRRAGDVDAWVARGWSGARVPGDDDHAYFQFHREETNVKIAVGSPGFGLTGVLLTTLFLGNRVDVRCNGLFPSEVIDLSRIAPDQAWLHQGPFADLMRCLPTSEMSFAREAFRLVRSIRELTVPLLAEHVAPVEQLRDQALAGDLAAVASALRKLLEPMAYHVEETELFRLVGEMEAEAAAARAKRRSRPDRGNS